MIISSRILFPLLFLLWIGMTAGSEAGEHRSKTSSVEGTAKLTWEAPTTNVNGTLLTDLAGYKIYYGPASGKHDADIVIVLPLDHKDLHCKKKDIDKKGKKKRTECSYTVCGLGGGARYFVIKAYNKAGKESDFSNEVKKMLPDASCPGDSY